MQCGSKVIVSSSASMNVFQHESFPLPEKLLVISAPLNAWNSGTSANLTLPRALAIGRTKIVGQTHDGYHSAYQRQIMSSHTAPDSASEAELKHLCLENGYKSLLQRWQYVDKPLIVLFSERKMQKAILHGKRLKVLKNQLDSFVHGC